MAAADVGSLLADIERRTQTVPDQWQLQVLGRVLARARVALYSSLEDDDVRAAHLTPIHDISAAVAQECERLGGDATVCALPEGPQTIAYLSTTSPVAA